MGKHIGYRLINKLENSYGLHLFPDALYLRAVYYLSIGYELNLSDPRRFTEKLQWLKLKGQYNDLTALTDKNAVKKEIIEKLGAEYVVPTLGIWDRTQDILWDDLPNSFIIKCTHDSGSVIICKDKSLINRQQVTASLEKSLSRNYFYVGREPNYKNIKPKIIAEPYMIDSRGNLLDYKFFCFHGKPKLFKIDFDRFTFHRANYYDIDGNLLPLEEIDYPRNPQLTNPYPEQLREMTEIAEKLAQGFCFMRVDLYCVDGKVYFGELTPFPGSGFLKYSPDNWDTILGDMLTL